MSTLSAGLKWTGRLATLAVVLFSGGLLLGDTMRPVAHFFKTNVWGRTSTSPNELDVTANLEAIQRSAAYLQEFVSDRARLDDLTDVLDEFDRKIKAIDSAVASLSEEDRDSQKKLQVPKQVLVEQKRAAVVRYADDLANRVANQAILAEVARTLGQLYERCNAEGKPSSAPVSALSESKLLSIIARLTRARGAVSGGPER